MHILKYPGVHLSNTDLKVDFALSETDAARLEPLIRRLSDEWKELWNLLWQVSLNVYVYKL